MLIFMIFVAIMLTLKGIKATPSFFSSATSFGDILCYLFLAILLLIFDAGMAAVFYFDFLCNIPKLLREAQQNADYDIIDVEPIGYAIFATADSVNGGTIDTPKLAFKVNGKDFCWYEIEGKPATKDGFMYPQKVVLLRFCVRPALKKNPVYEFLVFMF